jgi:hypothetical protein
MDVSDRAARDAGSSPSVDPEEIERQVNKRLTLNLLIQGAAAHTFITGHHLVRDELAELCPGFVELYDKLAISVHLNYWIGDIILLHGFGSRFWNRIHQPSHPYHRHRLLAKHGLQLSRASKQFLRDRGRGKGVISVPIVHYAQMTKLIIRAMRMELNHNAALVALAKRATHLMWGIDEEQLVAELTHNMAMRNVREPKSLEGWLARSAAVGWGGVQRRDGKLYVVAKAIIWPLLLHELTKGVAELVSMHGLNTLDDATYGAVIDRTDHIEYEASMLQAGPEAWRLLLAALPPGRPLAEMLMHIARLDPDSVEELMLAVIEDPQRARRLLTELGDEL